MEIDEIKKIQIFGLEYYGKYYGVYAGIVTSNKDPQSQGRVKVQVPALGRDDPLAEWAYPVSPFSGDRMGFFFPPEDGSAVWVMFEGGNPSLPIYLGGWWKNPSKTASGGLVPTDAQPSGQAPTIRGLKTKSGHRIIFDEGNDPGITIQTANGNIIRMKDSSNNIEIVASGEISAKATTVKVQATSAEVSASSVKVSASTADVQANFMNLASSLLRLNNGVSPVARIGDGTQAGGSITTGNPTILG